MNDPARIRQHTVDPDNALQAEELEADIARELARRIARGDRGAEDAAYRRYSARMRHVVRRFSTCEADAEDWHSIAWMTALPKLRAGELVNHESLAAFLLSLARYVALGERRKRPWLHTSGDNEYLEAAADHPDPCFATVLREQQIEKTAKLLQFLPVARDRELIRRRFLENCPTSELCVDFDVNSSQLSRLLHRARKRLLAQAALCGEHQAAAR